MRITQIRDDGRVNTLRTLKIEQLVEQMKVETKAQLVSGMREVCTESAEVASCGCLCP